MTTTPSAIDAMLSGYVECALWSSTDDNGTPMDDRFIADDIDAASLAAMRADCEAFATANADDLAEMEAEQAGHDFWLTRNHHGAGFWDRGLGERGQRLTDAAHAYGESHLWDNGDDKVVAA